MSLLSIDMNTKVVHLTQGSTDTDTVTDKETDTETTTVTVTDTNINKDTAYSQLLSKTFEIFFSKIGCYLGWANSSIGTYLGIYSMSGYGPRHEKIIKIIFIPALLGKICFVLVARISVEEGSE